MSQNGRPALADRPPFFQAHSSRRRLVLEARLAPPSEMPNEPSRTQTRLEFSDLRNSSFEPIARLPYREDVPRLRRIILDFPAQFRDVDVHRTRHHFDAMAPHLTQQLDTRRDGAATAHERQKKIELLRAEP